MRRRSLVHADQPADHTWRRFTWVVAILAGLALAVGLALSYASVYRVAYHAGFDTVWIYGPGWQLRPAHLFPLTLDVPVLVGYAGTIALAGRRSVAWARAVLAACSVATVAAQVVDGAGLIAKHDWIQALVHGWPPALAILTAHLLVKILQALGFLVPPVAEAQRPTWVVRAWTWIHQAVADMLAARRAIREDMDRDARADTVPDTKQDLIGDIAADTEAGIKTDIEPVVVKDIRPDKPQVTPGVILFTGLRGRLVAQVLDGKMTQKEAAARAKVDPKTVGRWVKQAREAQATDRTEATG